MTLKDQDEVPGRGLSADAEYDLAFRALQGRGMPQSLRAACTHFARAAELGHALARSIHRNFLAAGIGANSDWPRVLGLLQAAATDGDRDARRHLQMIEAMALTSEGDPQSLLVSEQLSNAPDVSVFRNLFSKAECLFLIDCAQPIFEPAMVGHIAGGFGQQIVRQIRTCDVAHFPWVGENPAIHALNRRMAVASGTLAEQGEPLQILRYRPGQEFKPHGDATEDRHNQRIFTMLVYLNEGYFGGETMFLKSGLKVRGRTGDAILFRNAADDGTPDPTALHAGLPVTAGEKYLASRWIRQKRFGPPNQ